MLHAFISVAPWFLFFVAIEHLGKTELAISNITRSVSAIFFVIANSFAVTTGSLVSNAIGAGGRKELFPICHKVLKLGYTVGIPLVGLALLCNHWIVSFYTDNELLIELAFAPFVVMLLNYCLSYPVMYISMRSGEREKTKSPFCSRWQPPVCISISLLVELLYRSVFTPLLDGRISVCDSAGTSIYHLSKSKHY